MNELVERQAECLPCNLLAPNPQCQVCGGTGVFVYLASALPISPEIAEIIALLDANERAWETKKPGPMAARVCSWPGCGNPLTSRWTNAKFCKIHSRKRAGRGSPPGGPSPVERSR